MISNKTTNLINKISKFASSLLIAVFVGIVAYYYLYMYYDERISCRIRKDVIVINGLFSSMYLLKSDSGYIAFDAGFDENIIRRGLRYNNLKPEDIRYLFLTHTDVDHQRAVHLFKNAKIYIPGKEVGMIKDHIPRFASFPYYVNEIKIDDYNIIKEGTVLNAGDRVIKCISLPGHTLGSAGYIVDGAYLFSGDAFRIKNGRISIPFKKFFTMNIDLEKKTLRLTAELKNIKYIFTSHSGFTADFNFAVKGLEK